MEDPVVDKIVNYTLHILFLVTGEEYMIVKKMPTGKSGANRPDIKLLTDKILELTNNIIHLVSAQEKVPPADKEITQQTPQPAGTGQANVIPEPVKMEQDFTPCMKGLQQSQEKGILTEHSGSKPQSLVKSEPDETSCVTGLQQPKEKEMAEVNLTDTAVCDTRPAVKMELDAPSSSALQKPEAMEISEDIRPGPSNVVVKTEPEELPCVKGLLRLKEKEITTNITSGVAEPAPDVVVKMEPEEVPCGEKTQQPPLQKKAPVAIKTALPTYIVTCAPDPGLSKGIDLQGRTTSLVDRANVSSFSSPKATATPASFANPGSFTTVKCQWGTGPWIQAGGSAVLLAPAACFVATPPDPWKIIFPPKSKPNRPPAVYDENFLKQRRLERQSRPPLFRLEDSHLWDPIIIVESKGKKIPPSPEVASGKPKRLGHTDWCSCYNCSVMPTEEESVCCRNVADMDRLFTKDITCVCDLDYVKNKLLDRAHVKELHGYAASYKKTHLCNVADMMERDVRKAAYRAFTLWIYGHLGSKSRRPIPSCVVDCVRAHFSALDHTYIGIRTAEDDYDATDMCT